MKTNHRLLAVFLAAAFVLVHLATLRADDPKPKKEEVAWQSFEQGLALAKKEKKMTVVDFYTTWCGWCKVMDKDTYGHASIVKYAKEKLVLVKVNAESDEKTRFREQDYTYRELAAAFGVNSYPATAFIDAAGEVLTLVPGYIPADKFLPVLEFLNDGHHKTMTFEAFLAKRNGLPTDASKSDQ